MIIKGFQQQKYRQEEDLPKLFLEVNDYEISGYAGYTKTITLDNLKFHLNLRWELERNFILNFVQKPEIFLKFFTGCILALGTYFYTFYSNLYAGLLLQESTQKQALKCFPEVAFMIGSTQRSKLSSEFLIIFRQFQTNMIEQQQQCNQETCSMVYNLINAVLILLDNVNLIEIELFRCLLIEPFNHIIRFNCDPMIVCSRNFRLHKLLIGRLYKLLKNSDHPILQEKCFEHILLNLLFDTTEFKLEQMQKESIMLFARYCKVKNIFIDNDGNAEEDDNKIKEKTSVNRSDEGDIHQNKHHYQQKHKLRKYSNEKLLPNTQQQDGSSSSNDVKIEKFRDLLFKYWPETFEQNQQQLDRVLSDLISPLVEYGFPIIS
uniref:Uncharacterized protein LOC113795769 n=1 Tax=Dermatophagoides pteronyssinus TaxID=6956 RepID=A0A6P6Y8U4_DERPT|nr:uncharacterized protein LOC113795769 [Dermatophagoides pteronyssinus]